MAPRVGLEPTTYRLTAGCSAIELPRNDRAVRDLFIILNSGADVNTRILLFLFIYSNNSLLLLLLRSLLLFIAADYLNFGPVLAGIFRIARRFIQIHKFFHRFCIAR